MASIYDSVSSKMVKIRIQIDCPEYFCLFFVNISHLLYTKDDSPDVFIQKMREVCEGGH